MFHTPERAPLSLRSSAVMSIRSLPDRRWSSRISRRAKLRPLAGWGAKRVASLPDVATFKELGYDIEFYIWAGLFAPRGTPAPVMKISASRCKQAVNTAEFKSAMEKLRDPDRLSRCAGVPEILGQGRKDARRRHQAHGEIGDTGSKVGRHE